ncbi:endolytic transglycosylase MltG [Pseudarthrobacter sp. 1G09]|uniref:endolytic transglycosylase MltG n=1 Tax=Pseudarthrobacter sp. 1G09 TaxID=3416178 RepID=UPI003CF17A7F
MSPANIDDASGPLNAGGGRPLTRKEIRAREKSLDTGGQGAVPEQAYETGADVPPQPADPPAVPAQPATGRTGAAPLPAAPAAPPSIQEAVPGNREPDNGTLDNGTHDDGGHHGAAPHEPAAHGAPEQPEPVADDVSGPHEPDHRHGEVFAADDHQDPHAAGEHPATDVHEYAGDPHYADPAQYPDGHEYHDNAHYGQVHGDADYHHDLHAEEAGHHAGHSEDAHHADTAAHSLIAGAAATQVVGRPSKKVRRRRRLLALFLTLAVFVTAVAVGAQFLKPLLGSTKASDFPGPGSGQVQVTVDNGEGTRSVAMDLENKGVVANADTFLQAFSASGGTLAPGDYTFKSQMKNKDAVDVLLGQDKGKVIYFALSAGLRVNESLQAISEGSGVSIQQLQALSNDPAQFGLPANAKNLEGYLAPGEHRFPLGTSAKDILQALVKVTVDELVSQGITDPAKQYQSVIVASIVQAEGGQAEYGDVAGAIYNRLKPNDQTGGFLQVDSAVTYGLGTKSYNFTDEQRQDKSNPYNTYANPGLPPGPIGSPGKTAIDAAARPKTNDYLFWVTVNLDTKETKFAKTLAEHNVYVEQYNSWCRANVGRCT